MKRVLLPLAFLLFIPAVWGQTTHCPCKTTDSFNCDDSAEQLCGTIVKPLRLELVPENCDPSMYDNHAIYCEVEMAVPGKPFATIQKIPSDRFVYFVNKGIVPDSFTVQLDSNVVEMVKRNGNWTARVLREVCYKSFHLDINTPELNVIVDRNAFGTLSMVFRTPKRNQN